MILITLYLIALAVDLTLFINDKYVASFFLLLGTLVASYFFVPEASQIVATYGWMGMFTYILPVYLGIGIGVAVIKWFLYNLKIAGRIKDAIVDFKKKSSYADKSGPEINKAFLSFWNSNYRPRVSEFQEYSKPEVIVDALTPKAKEEVDRISFWILQWPIVVVATLLEDLLVKLGKHVAQFFDYAFNQLARKLVANAAKDL